MLGRPIRHDHDWRRLGKARAHDVGRTLREHPGRRRHDHHRCLGLGSKRRDGKRDRGEPKSSENIHLVAGQKLLRNALAVVGNESRSSAIESIAKDVGGTSSPDDKLTGDLPNEIETTHIGGFRSDRVIAGKLAPGSFGLLHNICQ
jgi:hypothetical protein